MSAGTPAAPPAAAPPSGQYAPVNTPPAFAPVPPASYPPPPPAGYPPPQPQGSYPPPSYPPAPPPQGSGGSSAVKIILIIVAVIIGLIILAGGIFAYTVYHVAHSIVHVDGKDGGSVTLNTPGGQVSVNSSDTKQYSAEELGTDIYPGAVGGHGSMKMDLPTGSMVTGIFLTSDSKDQVVAYYKDKLGSEASVYDSAESAMISVNRGQTDSLVITVTANSHQNDGKTQISITHTRSNKSN
jgi:hypothetical protein